MAIDLDILGSKLSRYRVQFQADVNEVSVGTGIAEELITAFEAGEQEPTGDQILILADFYKCDYKFFLSNEQLAPFEQTDTLFRMHGEQLSSSDRWAIQEFLFLCECEQQLMASVPTISRTEFSFRKQGNYFKGHGEQAASALRTRLGYETNAIGMDVFGDFRSIGLHLFRRRLENSDISGLFVRHPVAGPCLLINYSEDVYRQRFTAAHEAGHAILDDDKEVNVSFTKWDRGDLSETRANTFASHYLMPRDFIRSIPNSRHWPESKALEWANKLKVSTSALSFALLDLDLIDEERARVIRRVTVPPEAKQDAELPATLSPASRLRKLELLEMGLATFYVDLCFDAYEQDMISAGRLAEMLLISPQDIHSLAVIYGRKLIYGD